MQFQIVQVTLFSILEFKAWFQRSLRSFLFCPFFEPSLKSRICSNVFLIFADMFSVVNILSPPGSSLLSLESWLFAFFLSGESLSPSVEFDYWFRCFVRYFSITMAICHFTKSQKVSGSLKPATHTAITQLSSPSQQVPSSGFIWSSYLYPAFFICSTFQ